MVWRDDLTLWHVDIQLKRLFFSHWIVFMPLSANQLIIMWGVISELSVLFCWSLCIPLCQFHTVLKGTEFELDKVNWTWGYTVTEVPPKCFRVFKVFLYTWSHLSLVAILGVNASPAVQFSSVQFSRSVVSASLRPHEPQHARPPCPSPTPGVHPNPCPLSWWCHPTISSSVIPSSSCPQSFPVQQAEWQIPRPTQSEIVVVPGPTYGPQDSWSSALITPSWLLAVQKFGESKMYREKLGYNCGRRGRM